MPLNNTIKEKISIEVIKVLLSRFDNFPEDSSNNRNAPFHQAFLNAFSDKFEGKVSDIPFFISLSSWAHGLSTTLGQNFFENIAKHLCNGEKREYTSGRNGNLDITLAQANYISDLIIGLSNKTYSPNLETENERIFDIEGHEITKSMNFSADIYFEDQDNINCIELKSVKPNAGEMRGEKQKIISGKAALKKLNPGKNINFFIGFPFDPTANPAIDGPCSYDKDRFLGSIIDIKKYFHKDEVLVASELWDYLSGEQNTMEEIINIINSIATPRFLEIYEYLNINQNRSNLEYIQYLENWNLYSEKTLIENNSLLIDKIGTNKNLLKEYNKTMFDKGNYKFQRFYELSKLLG